MILKNIVIPAALLLGVLGGARPAQAQIYTWKDPNGLLVLSNVPKGGTPASSRSRLTAHVGDFVPLNKGSQYEQLIRDHSTLQGVRADLVRAVIQVESAFNQRAVSPKGAMGLMQLMPATAVQFGVMNPFDPSENIRGGVAYLKQLLLRYDNNEQLALAAYNAGPLAVDRHGSRIPPYRETQDYVRRINALRGSTPGAPGSTIYKQIDIVDGQPVILYTDRKPATGSYQELAR